MSITHSKTLQPKEECAAGYENPTGEGETRVDLQYKQTGRDTNLGYVNLYLDKFYAMADTTQRTALIKSLVDQG